MFGRFELRKIMSENVKIVTNLPSDKGLYEAVMFHRKDIGVEAIRGCVRLLAETRLCKAMRDGTSEPWTLKAVLGLRVER